MRYNVPAYIPVEAEDAAEAVALVQERYIIAIVDDSEYEHIANVADNRYERLENSEIGEDMLTVAGRMYNPERHDPDSIFFDDSYTGPSERELLGGCNRCGGLDDCYCD